MTNHLVNATSPYLLQHAHNPVDWYPWGQESLEKARNEDKPIFLSIGYSACHWCHVMAHESFEDSETAAIMNQNFISIKVDREERPDLDSIYMSAVVALTGQGGWPMSVFLTPDLVPFYGGTYFPPQARYGLPSFREILTSLALLWKNDRKQVVEASKEIAILFSKKTENPQQSGIFTQEVLAKAAARLLNTYDWEHGGWGQAPKFPQPMALEFLIRRYLAGEKDAVKPVLHALHAMARGGMYDVVAGGFSRYSTDNNWLVPHFEKMLYDNAQLALVYLHAWQFTKDPFFRQVVEKTLDFVSRDMLSPEGGFFASLDADSEGVEGKFYVWTKEEMRQTFGGEDELFEAAYGITMPGNWEGKIILQRVKSDLELAKQFGLTMDEIQSKLTARHSQLLSVRNSRISPGKDDKVLTFWNGLMLSAFAEAARFLDNAEYLQIAQKNADFILKSLREEGQLRRAWRNGGVSHEVFLEDYAALILGLIDLYQTDFNNHWFVEAYNLTQEMIQRFSDPTGGFFDTTKEAKNLLVRPKEIQDNATPSGNSLAVEALLKMAAFSENEEWRKIADASLGLVARLSSDYPIGYSRWLTVAEFNINQTRQIAIVGNLNGVTGKPILEEINKTYRPNTIVAASTLPLIKGAPKLLLDRPMIGDKTTVYVCQGFVCKQPTTDLEELARLLD